MSGLGAKEMEGVVKEVGIWYAETRLWLIEHLEEDGYPYGMTPKPEVEQLMQFLNMTPQGYADLFAQFKERYRGLPDAYDRAVKDMDSYRQDMTKIRLKIATEPQGVIYG